MNKKALKILTVVLVVACIFALCLVFSACGKPDDGNNTDGNNTDGNNNDVTIKDISSDVKIKIVPTVTELKFSNGFKEKNIDKPTYYYAPEMDSIVKRGGFNMLCDFAITIEYNGKTAKETCNLSLSASGSHKSSGKTDVNYTLDVSAGEDVSFVMSKLQSYKISSIIQRQLINLGASEYEARMFVEDSTLFSELNKNGSSLADKESRPNDIDRPDSNEPIYRIDLCKFIEGFVNGKANLSVPQIVSIKKPIEGKSLTIDITTILNDLVNLEPYSAIDFNIFRELGYDIFREICEDLKKDTCFLDEIDENSLRSSLNITADNFDKSCTILNGEVVLDRNEIVFRVNLYHKTYTFTINNIGDFFVSKYSTGHESLNIEADRFAIKYDFEGTHPSSNSVKVKVFEQEAEVPVVQTNNGYEVDKKQLPLFFADRNGFENCMVVYNGTSTNLDWYNKNPNNVRLNFSEADAGKLSLQNIVLTLIYDDYETSIDAETLATANGLYRDLYDGFFINATYDNNSLFVPNNNHPGIPYVLRDEILAQAFDAPYVYNAIRFNIGENTYTVSMSVKINKTVQFIYVAENRPLKNLYKQYEDAYISSATNIIVYYNVGTYRDKYETETMPLTASLLSSFSTEEVATRKQYMVILNGKEYALEKQFYDVEKNNIVSLNLAADALDGLYVKGESFDFKPFKATITFESGLVKTIDVTKDMLSGYDENVAGLQTVTVTFDEITATKDIFVKEVSSLEFYGSELEDTYLLNETPSELEIKTIFSDGDFDVIALSEQQIQNAFDSSSVGTGRFTFSYGGKTISKTFRVVDAAYLYYNVDETTKEADIIGFGYEKTDRAYRLTSCSEIEIPSVIGEYTVAYIDKQAFKGANGIKSIVVPESVTQILGSAFSNCTSLKSLTINGNPTVGSAILYGCSNLEYLQIPSEGKAKLLLWFLSSIDETKDNLLPSSKLTVKFAEGSETIPDSFFNKIDASTPVQKLVLPQSLISIGKQGNSFKNVIAFEAVEGGNFSVVEGVIFSDEGTTLCYYPVNLKNQTLVIGDNVVKLGEIMNNSHLKTVVIGKNVAELSEEIFSNCTALESVTFNGSLKALPDYAFEGCSALTTFTFPKGLESIGRRVLMHSGLTEIIIPDSVTTIGTGAFYSVPVKRIYIPAHLTDFFNIDNGGGSLGWGFFNTLETITYSGSIPLDKLTILDSTQYRLKEVYLTVTVCDNWARKTVWPEKVYALEAVTHVGAYAATSDYTLYSERSSGITYDYKINISYNQTIHYWWIK